MILLLTAPTNISVAQPGAEPARHRQTWRELVVLAEGRPDLTFAIKPHPAYDFVEFYRYLCQAGPPNLVLLAPNSLGVALRACDVAVLVNYCSTVALEAMQAGVPVVFIRTAIYQTEMHKDPLEERGAVNVTSVAELEISVDRLLRDRAFRQNVIDDAELLVRSLVGEQPNSALKRLMTEFEKITTTADDNPAPVTTGLGESNVEAILDQMRRLLVSNDLPQFLSKTEELARIAKRTSSEEKDRFEDILWGMAFTVGYSISDPKELKKVVQVCYGQLWDELGLCRAVSSEVVIRAYLVAIMHSIDFGKFDRARSLLWQALTQVPGVALRTRMFWEYLAKSLVGRNRYAMLLVNGIDRLRLISTRLIAPAHITSRIKHLWPA